MEIRGLFRDFFSQFRSAGLVRGVWDVGASGAVTKDDEASHHNLSLTRTGTGAYTLAFSGGLRNLEPISEKVTLMDSDDPTDLRSIDIDSEAGGVDETEGNVYYKVSQREEGATQSMTIADPPSGSQIRITLWVAK